jgi:5-methylcytosine-specific restriction endonuclease McrA
VAKRRGGIHHRILQILKRHPAGVTSGQIRRELRLKPDEQAQLDRRRRDLRAHYIIETFVKDGEHHHRLVGKRPKPLDDTGISLRLRAEVLREAHGRCQMCGAGVEEGARLVVDHKVPREWGGKTEPVNLWALCSDCNAGKKHHFASQDPALMKKVMRHESVHVRLGELLKASRPRAVPAYVMEFVADQSDWMKRTRELRYLGWEIETERKQLPTGKAMAHYLLRRARPWPADPTGEIRRFERRRALRNRSRRS